MCPQCTSESAHEKGPEDVAKNTVAGGPSDANQEGGDGEWDGTSTSTSSDPEPTTSDSSEPASQSPAPTTDSPSSPDQTGDSSAPSTDGESESTEQSEAPADAYDDWLKEDLVVELAERNLPVSGNKPELIARLRESDAAAETGE
jgi:hypothetical protein